MSTMQMPEILELLSEIEARDRESKRDTHADCVGDSHLGDPRGYAVLNTTGHNVGAVEDLYVDPNSRHPHYALLNMGQHAFGIGNRKVLVSYEDLELISGRELYVRMAAD